MKIGKKFLVTAILGVVCVFAAFAQTNAANLDAAIQQASSDITLRITAPKVALLNFNSPSNDLSGYILREMAQVMEKSKIPTLITRQNIDSALTALKLDITSDVTDANGRQIGRSVGADFVVTGALAKVGDNYRFRTRLINVATGTIHALADINIRDSQQIAKFLPAPVPAATPAPAVAPVPVAPAPAATPAPASAGSYKIGEKGPAGGLIFYDKGNNQGGWQYLEAAPEDFSKTMIALSESIDTTNTKERAVGKGKSNTDAIMKEAKNKGGGFGWAAQACNAYEVNGFDDWFLPSRDELHYMYGNLHMKKLGEFRNEWYWSSTGDSWIWAENFADGRQDNFYMNRQYRVRPIRQF